MSMIYRTKFFYKTYRKGILSDNHKSKLTFPEKRCCLLCEKSLTVEFEVEVVGCNRDTTDFLCIFCNTDFIFGHPSSGRC